MDKEEWKARQTDIGTTKPIRICHKVFGKAEAEAKPFEIAEYDFTNRNERLAKNPADSGHRIPDAIVSSCSECCMKEVNGRQNLLGWLFQRSRGEEGCRNCPVSLASCKLPARMADGKALTDDSGNVLSEADIVQAAYDEEK